MKYLLTTALILPATLVAEPGEWTLDLGHAHIGWDIGHRGLSPTVGRVERFDGTFLIDETAPEQSQITFASTAVRMLTPMMGKLDGDLTLRGVTAPVTLDFRLVRDRRYPNFIPGYDEIRVVGFEVSGEMLRLDHGMDFVPFLDSPTDLVACVDINLDLVDCAGMPEANVPCSYGRERFAVEAAETLRLVPACIASVLRAT